MEQNESPQPSGVSGTSPLPETSEPGGPETLQVPRDVLDKMLNMPVSEWILWCFSFLGGQAARHLGLAPGDKEEKTLDLDQAKLAIDGMGGLLQTTETHLPYEDVKNMRNVLTQLRLVYVQHSKEQGEEAPETE